MLLDILKKKQLEKTPYVYDVTVPEVLAEKFGFKSDSKFYLISDKKMEQEETPYKATLLKEEMRDESFRGVYCSPSMAGTVADIRADLKKYCELLGIGGLVKINGKTEKITPNMEQFKKQEQR